MQTTRRFRITGLLPNTVYRFAVSAANSAGAGPENVPRIVLYECRNGFKDTGAGCQVGWGVEAARVASDQARSPSGPLVPVTKRQPLQ